MHWSILQQAETYCIILYSNIVNKHLFELCLTYRVHKTLNSYCNHNLVISNTLPWIDMKSIEGCGDWTMDCSHLFGYDMFVLRHFDMTKSTWQMHSISPYRKYTRYGETSHRRWKQTSSLFCIFLRLPENTKI